MKKSDWLQEGARKLLDKYEGQIWTSPVTLTELLLLAAEFGLDPERLLVDVLEIAQLKEGNANAYFLAANYMKENDVGSLIRCMQRFAGRIVKS